MKEIRSWFPFYVADWINDPELQLCSLAAQGLLVSLMARSWHDKTPGIINRELEDVSYLLRIDGKLFAELLGELIDRNRVEIVSHENRSNTIEITRLQVIGKEQAIKHQRRVEAGRAGGRVSKRTKNVLKKKEGKSAKRKRGIGEDFEKFWERVPNKIGKGYARECFGRALVKATFEEIMTGLDTYHAYERRRREGSTDYRPLHPSTWLNQERWTDDLKHNNRKKAEITINMEIGGGKKFVGWTKEEAEEKKREYIIKHKLQCCRSPKGIEYYKQGDGYEI